MSPVKSKCCHFAVCSMLSTWAFCRDICAVLWFNKHLSSNHFVTNLLSNQGAVSCWSTEFHRCLVSSSHHWMFYPCVTHYTSLPHECANASLTWCITPAWVFSPIFYPGALPTGTTTLLPLPSVQCASLHSVFSFLFLISPLPAMFSVWHAGEWSSSSQKLHWWRLRALFVCPLCHSVLSTLPSQRWCDFSFLFCSYGATELWSLSTDSIT